MAAIMPIINLESRIKRLEEVRQRDALSYENLAHRIGIHPMTMRKILRKQTAYPEVAQRIDTFLRENKS